MFLSESIFGIENLVEALKIIITVSILFVWFVRYENVRKEFSDYGFPSWFRDIVGILKVSFSLMIHSANKQVVILGLFGVLCLMIGAVVTHIKMKNNFRTYIASVSMLAMIVALFYYVLQF